MPGSVGLEFCLDLDLQRGWFVALKNVRSEVEYIVPLRWTVKEALVVAFSFSKTNTYDKDQDN